MPTKALAMALQRIGEREKLAKVGLDASGHYHDEHGLFASQGGMEALHHILNPHLGATSAWGGGQGGGSSISGGKEGDRVERLNWSELTSEEKHDRSVDYMSALQVAKDLATNQPEMEAAAAKYNRMRQFYDSKHPDDRSRLMQETARWHDQMRSSNPTAGSREALNAQQDRVKSERELAALAANINLKDPKVLRAVQAAAVRHMQEREADKFRRDLAFRTQAAEGTVGGLTGRIARAGYHASNVVRSANNAWGNKSNLESLGRHLSELKSSLSALTNEAKHIPGEAARVGSSLWSRLTAAKDALAGVKQQIHQAQLSGAIHVSDESDTARNLREGHSVESTTHRGGIRII